MAETREQFRERIDRLHRATFEAFHENDYDESMREASAAVFAYALRQAQHACGAGRDYRGCVLIEQYAESIGIDLNDVDETEPPR